MQTAPSVHTAQAAHEVPTLLAALALHGTATARVEYA